MCCTIAYCAGIVLLRGIVYPLWILIPIGTGILLSVALIDHRRVSFLLAAVCFLCLGAFRGSMEWTAPPMPPFGNWLVEGTVDGTVRQDDESAKFYLSNARVTTEEGESRPIDSRIYVSCQAAMEGFLLHGQHIRVEGRSYEPRAQRNPGGFDQRLWLAENGAHVLVYSREAPMLVNPGGFSVLRFAIQSAQFLSDAIDAAFGEASPIVRAVLIGDQSEVTDEWYDWFRISGVAHILSVSGLHVGLWFALVDRLLRKLPISPAVRFLLLAFLLAIFSLLTGLRASVIRASVMLLVLQGGKIFRRKSDPLTSLSIAALIILLFRPIDLLRAGFQLSFCAVLGIFLLMPQLSRFLRFKPKWLSGTICVSLSAQLGAMPAMAYWFHQTSLLGIPANALAVPISGFLVPVSALAVLLSGVTKPLGWLFVEAGRGMVAAILLICKWASMVEDAVFTVVPFALWTIAVYGFLMILQSSAAVWRAKKRILAAAIAIFIAACVGIFTYNGETRYVQLDVGEALSGVLHVGGQTFVYDCGRPNSDLTEYLLTVGEDVDALFLSHAHSDHIGGLEEMLSCGIGIRTIYVPAYMDISENEEVYSVFFATAEQKGAKIIEVAKGDVLDLNGLTASVLSPERERLRRNHSANEQSIVLLIEIGERKLLLCGDADGALEPAGVACDVLQVAHHGSKNAAGDMFIQGALPEIALVSVGSNSYGHPDPQMLERIHAVGADIYRTDETGAITVFFGSESLRVEVFCP